MDNLLRDRAELFGKYVSAEIKGAIVAQGYTQTEVAKGIDRQGANLSRWLSGKPTIPIEVALEVCNYIGVNLQKIVDRAQQRVEDELGPWPPIEIDPAALSEDEKKRIVLDKLRRGDTTLAANDDENKEAERDYYPDAGA
jgi:transcriptional regulator with XRE-family HTH domain